jgi:hypothetical protein
MIRPFANMVYASWHLDSWVIHAFIDYVDTAMDGCSFTPNHKNDSSKLLIWFNNNMTTFQLLCVYVKVKEYQLLLLSCFTKYLKCPYSIIFGIRLLIQLLSIYKFWTRRGGWYWEDCIIQDASSWFSYKH